MSDHEGMTVIDLDIKPKLKKAKPREVKQFAKADWDAIRKEASEFNSSLLENVENNSVDSNWEVFKEHVNCSLAKHLGLQVYQTY